MKVYVTKYAVSQGIIEHEAEVCNGDGTMIRVMATNKFCLDQYFHKGEWFTDPEEARKKAYEKLAAKIKSVKKSLLKLEKMKF